MSQNTTGSMATRNSKTKLRQKITSEIEINKQNFDFQGNQRKVMTKSIFSLQFLLKKQNKSNLNKYTTQCTNTKAIYWLSSFDAQKRMAG